MASSWREVKIYQFQEIEKLQAVKIIDKLTAHLQILTGIKEEDLLKLPLTEVAKLHKHLDWINEDSKEPRTLIVEINGVEYGFQHKLTKMDFGEFIDFDSLLTNSNPVDSIHTLMAVLYRPIIKKGNLEKDSTDYKIEEYDPNTVEGRAAIFQKEMTVNVVLSAMLFLQALVITLSKHTADCLNKKTTGAKIAQSQTKMKKTIQISQKNGGGLYRFFNWLDLTNKNKKTG